MEFLLFVIVYHYVLLYFFKV